MKKVITLMIIALLLVSNIAYGGWKENYRTRYSKKNIDPNSEKAKKIKSLSNLDFKYTKWTRTAEERKALGLREPVRSLSGHLMPSKREGEGKDKFEGFTSNFSPKEGVLPGEEPKVKSGYTLTGAIKSIGKTIETETIKIKEKVVTEAEEVK